MCIAYTLVAVGSRSAWTTIDVATLLHLLLVPVTIPQRELRNQIGDVLRRAENGERFTITVGGRPVAELGPLASARKPAVPERLAAILAEAPPDVAWAAQLREMREEDLAVARDTWAT